MRKTHPINNHVNSVLQPPTAAVFPSHTTYVSGCLSKKAEGTSDAASIWTSSDSTIKMDLDSVLFSKPATSTAADRTGNCRFFVYGVPMYHPFFELEFSIYRTVGVAKDVTVKLEVIQQKNTGTEMKTFNGTLHLPAACPVITSQLVSWTDGEEDIESFDGEVRSMPRFYQSSVSHGIANVQTRPFL